MLVGEEACYATLASAGAVRWIRNQDHVRMRSVFLSEATTRGLAEVETTATCFLIHSSCSWALLALGRELLIELTSHELVLLFLAHLEVVLLHHLVGEIGTCFECKTLGLAEGVVTVEEDVFDLLNESAVCPVLC